MAMNVLITSVYSCCGFNASPCIVTLTTLLPGGWRGRET
jgi:hypothetical protein